MRWPWSRKQEKKHSSDLITQIKKTNPRKSLTLSILALERRLEQIESKLEEYKKMAR